MLLYEAEIDHGRSYRSVRLAYCCFFTPWGVAWMLAKGYTCWQLCGRCFCDEVCCWVRKEYSTRMYFRIYPNRIEVNKPKVRFPFGYCGCGSWSSDNIVAHPFDRGAFGFSHVKSSTGFFLCCLWPMYGGVVARRESAPLLVPKLDNVSADRSIVLTFFVFISLCCYRSLPVQRSSLEPYDGLW